MYQFSEQLYNAIAPVHSAFAPVPFYELSEAHRATAFGDPYACAIPEAIHRWGMEIFPAFQKSDTIMIRARATTSAPRSISLLQCKKS